MHRVRPAVAALVLAAALATDPPVIGAEGASAPPGAEVFGALPATTDVVLTPDGKRLAWVDNGFDNPRVVMFDITARKELRVLALPERLKIRRIFWNDDETLVITFSETRSAPVSAQASREYYVNIAYDAGGGEGRMLPAMKGNNIDPRRAMMTYLVRARPAKPHTLIMASFACVCLLEVDTNTGEFTQIKAGNVHTIGWVVNREGSPVAREDWDWKTRAYRVYALSGNSVRDILHKDDSSPPRVAGLLGDNTGLVVLAENGRPHQAAWALPLDGGPMRLLAEDSDADVTSVYTDDYSGAITGVYLSGSKTRIDWLDPASQHRYDLVKKAFPKLEIVLYGRAADDTRIIAEAQSPMMAPVYYLIDFSAHRADIVAEHYPRLAGVQLGEFKEITYRARDGTQIPAYLTLPAGQRSGPGSLVVLPHGGPQARDLPQFDWLVQFLATRGYAVLQPQFRGSVGFGDAFERAGYRQWGGLMQDDLTDGVRAMIEQGIADQHHVAIVGMSYGGYAALAGAAFTPELYACAVSINGISDLRALMRAEVPMYGVRVRYISAAQSNWEERIGKETDTSLDRHSPINSVSAIRSPVLIVYGSGDGIVPNDQSEHMAEVMRKAGKAVTLAKLPDEDHWLSRTETRVQLLQTLESFLREHL